MAEAYYEPTPATDGATMNPVPGAPFQVFEIADTTFSTPLSLRVGSGNPTTMVTASDTLATLPGVYVTSPNFEHIWVSGSFQWRRDSIDGAKGAIERAESSALSAANAAADAVTQSSLSAQAAQDAAALVDAPADTVMRDVAANPNSAFATALTATTAEAIGAAVEPDGVITGTIAEHVSSADTVVLLGTSITAQNGALSAVPGGIGHTSVTGYESASDTNLLTPDGYWHHAAIMCGHRLTVVANKGVGGNSTTQMLARFDADVLGLNPLPSWLLLEPGPNDQGGGVPAATSISNITEMIRRARLAGMRVILCTITPSNTLTTAGNAGRARVNAWIKQNAPSLFPGTLIVDWTKSVVDPAGGPLLTAFRNESGSYVHPTPYGAALMGRELANVITAGIPYIDRLPSDPSDPLNLAANAFNAGTEADGTGGQNIPGVSIGKLAGGAISGTKSIITRTDGIPGQWWRAALTGGDVRFRWDNTDTTKWVPGDWVYGHIEFRSENDWVTPRGVFALVEQIDAGGAVIKNSWGLISRGADPDNPFNPRAGVMFVPPFKVLANVTRLRMQLQFRLAGGVGSGTIDLGRRGFYKIGA